MFEARHICLGSEVEALVGSLVPYKRQCNRKHEVLFPWGPEQVKLHCERLHASRGQWPTGITRCHGHWHSPEGPCPRRAPNQLCDIESTRNREATEGKDSDVAPRERELQAKTSLLLSRHIRHRRPCGEAFRSQNTH